MAKTEVATKLWGYATDACWYLSGLFEGLAMYCEGEITFRGALKFPGDRRKITEHMKNL